MDRGTRAPYLMTFAEIVGPDLIGALAFLFVRRAR
jgi:hypothetical protein